MMNWEIEDCLIRLENQMYQIGGDRSASNDRYTVEKHIRDMEKEISRLLLKPNPSTTQAG
jgi:hypothetical protein